MRKEDLQKQLKKKHQDILWIVKQIIGILVTGPLADDNNKHDLYLYLIQKKFLLVSQNYTPYANFFLIFFFGNNYIFFRFTNKFKVVHI